MEKESKKYAIRVTVDRSWDSVATAYCRAHSSVFVLGAETGKETEKPHYQIYLETKTSRQTLANQIKKKFGVSGNEGFSIAIAKYPEQAMSYCCKEFVLDYMGIDIAKVPKYVPFGTSKRKTKTPTFTAQLLSDFGSRVLPPGQIYDWVYEYFVDRCKIFDAFIINRFFNLVLARTCPEGKEAQKAAWRQKALDELKGSYICRSKEVTQYVDPEPSRGVSLSDEEVLREVERVASARARLWSIGCQDPLIIQCLPDSEQY